MEGGDARGSRGVGRGRGTHRGGRQWQRHDQISGPAGFDPGSPPNPGAGASGCRSPNALWRKPTADRCSWIGQRLAKAPDSNSCFEPRLNGPEARGRASRHGSKSHLNRPPFQHVSVPSVGQEMVPPRGRKRRRPRGVGSLVDHTCCPQRLKILNENSDQSQVLTILNPSFTPSRSGVNAVGTQMWHPQYSSSTSAKPHASRMRW